MSSGNPHPLEIARSFLFVPGTLPERFDRALNSGAEAVILDLEDAVAPQHKAAARANVVAWILSLNEDIRARVLVRINSTEMVREHNADLAQLKTLLHLAPAGIVVPKAAAISTLVEISKMLPSASLVPLIESASGWAAVDALASAPNVARLAFGHLDFQLDMDMTCTPQQIELAPVRLSIVAASRRAGVAAPIDSVTPDIMDDALLEVDNQRAKSYGFGGRLCIHPRQIEKVHSSFRSNEAEVLWATRVLNANTAAAGEVFQLDGRMVDTPVLRKAERILKAAL